MSLLRLIYYSTLLAGWAAFFGWLASEAARFLDAYGLPSDLRGFGIPGESVAELAEKSSGSSMRGNPRELSMKERTDILTRVV